jgi:hypothetical protein
MSDVLVEKDALDDITIYRFLKNTRAAVDQYLDMADADAYQHEKTKGSDTPMVYIIDVSQSGMYPISYMKQKATSIMAAHDNFPKNYIAYVIDNPSDSMLINVVDAMTARDIENTRRVFKSDQLNEAVQWLSSIKS